MPVSMEDVRAALLPDEVDYASAARLGPESLPHLRQLVQGDDPMLAAKAAYLASMIAAPGQEDVLQEAGRSRDATVRLAAATALGRLRPEAAERLASSLLEDEDLGVRKHAVLAAAAFSDRGEVARRLRRVQEEDPSDSLRKLAERSLGS